MKVAIVGYGAMGQYVGSILDDVVGIVSPGYLDSLDQMEEKCDVIIDFSHPSNLGMIARYAVKNKVCVVLATTGYDDFDIKTIEKLSMSVPVLYSGNFSLGVILMNKLIREITPILKDDFDVEVIEKHHNKKIDAPSGTAKMLINSVNQDGDYNIVYGRSGEAKRNLKDLGVHSLRGGTIVGEHSVIFAGTDEILEVKHEAHSKMIFAKGAVKGAKWLLDKPVGLYNMEDVLF